MPTGFQHRIGHFGFDQYGGRHASREIVVDRALFDESELDVVDRNGFIGSGIEILDDLQAKGGVFAADDEIAATTGDFDIQRCRDLAQVFVECSAQVREPGVVDRFRGVVEDIGVVFVFAFHSRSVC